METVGVVQFYLPKPVAAAACIDQLTAKLVARGAEHTRFERSTFRAFGKVRVTAKTPIALAILDEIRGAREKATTFALRDACDAALRDVAAAIGKVHTGLSVPRTDSRSDAERGILGS
jgi:hypothetical protein